MTICMIGATEIIVIGAVVLLIFGGKKLPELMKGMGKGVRNFKEGMNEPTEEEMQRRVDEEVRRRADQQLRLLESDNAENAQTAEPLTDDPSRN